MDALLLANGLIMDGSGAPAVIGSVLLEGDRITSVGICQHPDGVATIDCQGLAIAPGFIDAHSHSDLQALEGRTEKSQQGVTSEVVGNCGFSTYPSRGDKTDLHAFANGILCGGHKWGWPGAAEYLAEALCGSSKVNVASLVGHGSLRIACAGPRVGPVSSEELAAMERELEAALDQGATGFSTGLMYAPGSSASFEELQRLCAVVARKGGIYTSHIRSYFSDLVEAVEEQLELARRTGCRLQISHLQAVGVRNWPLQQRALDAIEGARNEGIDVAFDCYPYRAGSTVLTQILPQWALDGGIECLLTRLDDHEERLRIAKATEDALAWNWSDIIISAVSTEENRSAVGQSIEKLAEERGVSPIHAVLDLLEEERGEVNMLSFNQSEDNLRQALVHPLSSIISDGFYVKGRPHPRLSGTFPLLLGTICRIRRWMPLEEAIRKITAMPAERFGLSGRGRLQPGYHADITVFNPDTVNSPATYENPEAAPCGIELVIRNGRQEWPASTMA